MFEYLFPYLKLRINLEYFILFSRLGLSVALVPVLELDLVDQAGPELTEIHLPLPPECWD